MKEKLPQGERPEVKIVGNAPKDLKEGLRKIYATLFGEGHFTDLPEALYIRVQEKEIQKEQLDRDIIRACNDLTNEVLERNGSQPFDIPERNIHILSSEFYHQVHPTIGKVPAATLMERQAIIIDDETRKKLIEYASSILHEVFHLKGYFAEESSNTGTDKNEYTQIKYRVGLMISSLSKKDARLGRVHIKNFIGLNEAVVSIFESTHLQELLERINSPDRNTEDFLLEINNDDSYLPQIKVFRIIVESIAEAQEMTEEEVINLFYKAHNDGHILHVAKLIEKTFGKGSFRFIGTMDKGEKSAGRVMDYLQKQRRLRYKKE